MMMVNKSTGQRTPGPCNSKKYITAHAHIYIALEIGNIAQTTDTCNTLRSGSHLLVKKGFRFDTPLLICIVTCLSFPQQTLPVALKPKMLCILLSRHKGPILIVYLLDT